MGYYVKFEEDTVWPRPDKIGDLIDKFVYGQPNNHEMLMAASYLRAYSQLFVQTNQRRNFVVNQIKKIIGW